MLLWCNDVWRGFDDSKRNKRPTSLQDKSKFIKVEKKTIVLGMKHCFWIKEQRLKLKMGLKEIACILVMIRFVDTMRFVYAVKPVTASTIFKPRRLSNGFDILKIYR